MLTLKLLLLSLTCVDLHSDNDIESECRYGARNKYSESYNRWSHYLDSIAAAERSHTPCEEARSCSSCHDAVIARDLAPFSAAGGVSRDMVRRAGEVARVTRYQIIGGKVYRSEECMFPFR